MIDLVSIDPGNEKGLGVCALALFVGGVLRGLDYCSWADLNTRAYAPQDVALEVPMIYPDGHERPNDLIKLAIAGALVAAALQPTVLARYTPAEWKGQKAKPACHLLLWRKLSAAEKALFPAGTEARIMKGVEVNSPRLYAQPLKNYSFKAHNLLDAVGIGFHHMGR